MYYEKKIIDGILCHRDTPDGDWVRYTQEELTIKLTAERRHKKGDLIALAPDMLVALEAEEEFWGHYNDCPACHVQPFCVDALALRLFSILMSHAVLADARA